MPVEKQCATGARISNSCDDIGAPAAGLLQLDAKSPVAEHARERHGASALAGTVRGERGIARIDGNQRLGQRDSIAARESYFLGDGFLAAGFFAAGFAAGLAAGFLAAGFAAGLATGLAAAFAAGLAGAAAAFAGAGFATA